MKNECQNAIKIIDDKGRIVILKELREIASIKAGDVIKVSATKKSITLRKVGIVDYEEKSPQDTESVIDNALLSLSEDSRLKIAKKVIDSIERNEK